MQCYDYSREKGRLFSDEGQRMFLRVRDFVKLALKTGGAVRMNEAMNAAGTGCSWTMMACVDRLVELGEIVEVTSGLEVAGQYRVFVDAR
jgi:hypothetical protein